MKKVDLKRAAIRLAGIFILMLFVSVAFAQGGDGGCDPLDPACPIDGGVSLLIAAGIGIAAKKAHNARKVSKN